MTQIDNVAYTQFVVLQEKVPDRATSTALIRDHVAYLRELERSGRLVLSGPFMDHAGGMLIIRARDKYEAMAIACVDPFVRSGVRNFDLRTLLLSSEENNHLGMG